MKAEPTVGVAIPSIPIRPQMLQRALKSVLAQTYPVAQISVAIDNDHEGAGATRNRAKNSLSTELTAFLDDDDIMNPDHIALLVQHMQETGADLVFSWFDVRGGTDPFPVLEHIEWNDETPHAIPITVLLRTELAQAHDFRTEPEFPGCANEDWWYWKELLASGAHFAKLHKRTWQWDHSSGNTSGIGDRWTS